MFAKNRVGIYPIEHQFVLGDTELRSDFEEILFMREPRRTSPDLVSRR